MSEEEPDYMSEDFVKSCVKHDIRPGLQFRRPAERLHQLEKRREELAKQRRAENRPRHELETEHRDRALDQPIDANNKGFAMLQKMGYKPGMAIGKQGDGLVEPIRPEMKKGRGGLGREAALQAVQRRKQEIRAREAERRERATSAAEFRRRLRDKMADRHGTADLMKSQRACEDLDRAMGVEAPADSWFWPPRVSEEAEDGAVEQEQEAPPFSPSEQLEMLTDYLRRTHLYCIWCGCAYDDDEDLKENCPGVTRDDH